MNADPCLSFGKKLSRSSVVSSGVTVKIEIRVAHSPDSDDAFMFYALATNKLDTGPYHFTHTLQDIESLNQRALRGEFAGEFRAAADGARKLGFSTK